MAEATDIASPRVCFLMPAFNEEAGLESTICEVMTKISSLQARGLICNGSFMMFVDDGSRDGTWDIIVRAHRETPGLVRGIRLAANRGKGNALFAGIVTAKGLADAVICMDADLQFDIDAVEEFLSMHAQGCELVYGIKTTRGKEPLYKRISARVFCSMMEFLGSPIIRNHADYCLLTRRVCEALAAYEETNLVFRGLLKQLGFKQASCRFAVKDRDAGESHFTPLKLINLSLDAITSFSVVPLRLIVFLGGLVFLAGVAMIIWTVYDACCGLTPGGYATLMCSMWFLGGLGMMCLGVVGEYLGKLYMEAKKRPRYSVAAQLPEATV